MKKNFTKTLLFILMICFCRSTNAQQTFCPPGAYWHYDVNALTSSGFMQIQYVNDTTIQGINCKRLTQTLYTFYSSNSNAHTITNMGDIFIYQSGDTVFRYNGFEFNILYNFSALPNDEWKIDSVNSGTNCDSVSFVHVDSVGTEIFNNDTLKWISVHPTTTSPTGLNGKIYERFGSSNYLIPININICDTNIIVDWTYYNIHCYEDSSNALYNFTSYDCEYLMHLGIDKIDANAYSIYPSPAKSDLFIDGPFLNQAAIRIINPAGQLMYSSKFERNNIGINLPDGIYYLTIESQNSVVTKKFMVIN